MAEVLSAEAIAQRLSELDGWLGSQEKIAKTYEFADFAEAMRFVNRVADLAEQASHHPDLHVHYNRVEMELTTHSAGGVTENDLQLARQIDAA